MADPQEYSAFQLSDVEILSLSGNDFPYDLFICKEAFGGDLATQRSLSCYSVVCGCFYSQCTLLCLTHQLTTLNWASLLMYPARVSVQKQARDSVCSKQ